MNNPTMISKTNANPLRRGWRLAMVIGLLVACLPAMAPAASAGKAKHVVIVVWDGMRPDFIGPEHTPTLSRLARQGTLFKRHHAVYVSSTEVNGTALITGAYPEHSGIIANKVYRADIDPLKAVATEDLETVRRGDWLAGGHYLAVPTLTEVLQRAGFRTAVAGAKPVALLLDRSNQRTGKAAKKSVDFYRGRTLPHSALAALVKANGGQSFPTTVTYPNVAQDAWTTKALTRGLWKKDVPKLSVLWLSDPDFSQHERGPGSATALGALESADRNLAAVLNALEKKKVRERTDIFVVSDHGFSTIERGVDVAEVLAKAGFRAVKRFEDPQPGDVLVVGLGGSVALYVCGHDATVVRRLAEFFQSSDFTGVILSRIPVEGTLPLDRLRVATLDAPDLLVSLRWSAGTNGFGTPGLITADAGKAAKGSHGSLSPFDLHNTLVAAGPDFRRGFQDELPSGNADLAPTVLAIFGIQPPQPMDGRVLTEALAGWSGPAPKAEQKTIEIEAARPGPHFQWRQYLKFSTVGNAIYFDEGNGESVPK